MLSDEQNKKISRWLSIDRTLIKNYFYKKCYEDKKIKKTIKKPWTSNTMIVRECDKCELKSNDIPTISNTCKCQNCRDYEEYSKWHMIKIYEELKNIENFNNFISWYKNYTPAFSDLFVTYLDLIKSEYLSKRWKQPMTKIKAIHILTNLKC